MNRLLAFVVALWLGIDTCPAPVDFDGADDYIDGGDISVLEVANVTISVWSRLEAENQYANIVAKSNNSSTGYIFQSRSNLSQYRFILRIGGSFQFVSGSDPVDDLGIWVHHCATYDGNTAKIYRNGAETGTASFSGTITYGTGNLRIGASGGASIASTEYFNGIVQDVRIYNRALSAAEIETLYKSRIGEGNPVSSGLVGYWPLNDNSGNLASATFVDRSGNGNSGTGSDAGGSGGQCSTTTFLTAP